jgi:hypothetical protein
LTLCFRRFALSTLILLAAVSMNAASFLVRDDVTMIENADAVVIATAISSHSELDSQVGIATVTNFSVERVLKSSELTSSQSVQVVELGGILDDQAVWVDDAPRFEPGQRLLLFLEKTADNRWRTLDMLLGKFAFASDDQGRRLLVREMSESALGASRETHSERVRTEDEFIDYIRSHQAGLHRTPDYFINASAMAMNLKIAGLAERSDYLMQYQSEGFRWQTPSMTFRRNGSLSGLNAEGAVTTAIAFWNGGAGSNVNVAYGGTTTSNKPNCAPSCRDTAGQNNIVFGDPNSIVSGTFSGSGVLGIGIVYGKNEYCLGSACFWNIGEAHIVMNDGISSSTLGQATLNHALAHEIGHTLGFRHSNEEGRTPFTYDALMRSNIENVYSSLRPYDLEALGAVYGSGPPACTPPSIVIQPQNKIINSGQGTTVSVSATGTGLTYRWYYGVSGNTSQPAGTQTTPTLNTGILTTTTMFWVRVSGECAPPVNSTTVTITVNPVTPPPCQVVQVTSQPSSQTITAGQTATLSFTAGGTTPLAIQWYQGERGNTSRPVAGGTGRVITISPASTTKFWAQIQNICTEAGVNTTAATVTVNAACPAGHLCLLDGRFRLAVFARDQRTGATATGQPVPENDVFGFFSLAALTGDAQIPEVFVKMLDATSLPGAKYWIFYGGLTDLEYTIVATDTKTGAMKQYTKVAGSMAGGVDLEAFTFVEQPATQASSSVEFNAIETLANCAANSLCLLNNRFEVSLQARDVRTGKTAVGMPVLKNDLFGYFSLLDLTGDSRNPEVFVKAIDATGPFGKYWFFHGGLTDLEYTITVRDTARGVTRIYFKPAGSFTGEADTAAFNP